MSMPFIEMPQRERGVAVDEQQAAAAGGAGRLAGVALHMDEARHHVLGDADPGIAMDQHGGELVHAGAVIADVAVDLDGDRRVQPGGDGVPSAGWSTIQCRSLVSGLQAVKRRVQLAERRRAEIDVRHDQRSQK